MASTQRLFSLGALLLSAALIHARPHSVSYGPWEEEGAKVVGGSSDYVTERSELKLPSSKSSGFNARKEEGKGGDNSAGLPVLPEDAWPDMSGYISINASAGAEMYFAYYEAREPKRSLKETPIILWLQGGPGCSSMVGMFYEIGPYNIIEEIPPRLVKNEGAWTDAYGVLFIDNPVGVGFSTVNDPDAIPNGELSVATALYKAITTFFTKHAPEYFKDRPFYIAGESYAGKYVPSLGYYTLKWREDLNSHSHAEPQRSHPFRLDGLVVGNGMTDPREMLPLMGPLFYYFGYIDGHQKRHIENWSKRVVQLIDDEKWLDAARQRRQLLQWLQNVTGLATLFNTRRPADYHKTLDGADILEELLNRGDVQKKLNVNLRRNQHFETCSSQVSNKLAADLMKSVRWMVNEILTTLPVLLFQVGK